MRKWLFTGIAVLSLFIFLTALIFLARSYWVQDFYRNLRDDPLDIHDPAHAPLMWSVMSIKGAIRVSVWRFMPLPTTTWVFRGTGGVVMTPPPEPLFVFSRMSSGGYYAVFPHWFVALLSVVFPVWWFTRFRRERRTQKLGLCPKCLYDLRASTERCPECGTAIALPPSPREWRGQG